MKFAVIFRYSMQAGAFLALAACQPTVKVQAPDKPIEINMNIHIEQEVRIRVERDLDSTIAQNPDLFAVPGDGR